MYFIIEDNGLEARLARLEGELEVMRAEIDVLRAAPAKPAASDRREYMREYMRRKRATAVATVATGFAGGGEMPETDSCI